MKPRSGAATAALLVSILALVVSLSAGALAAATIGKNLVVTKSIKNGAVTAKKLDTGAVDSKRVKDGSLRSADLAPGVVPVPGNGKAIQFAGCDCLSTAADETEQINPTGLTETGFGFVVSVDLEVADFAAYTVIQGAGQSRSFSLMVSPIDGGGSQEIPMCTVPAGAFSCKSSATPTIPADSVLFLQSRNGAGGANGTDVEFAYTLRVI